LCACLLADLCASHPPAHSSAWRRRHCFAAVPACLPNFLSTPVCPRFRPVQLGLSGICSRLFGQRVDKREQCSGWGKRPLTQAQKTYAAIDAHVLVRVHSRLKDLQDEQALAGLQNFDGLFLGFS